MYPMLETIQKYLRPRLCKLDQGTLYEFHYHLITFRKLELRILAHLSNCKSMLDAFEAGGDFHSRTAVNMYEHVRDAVENNEVLLEWHPQPGETNPPVPLLKDLFATERRKAKMLNFSIAYGKTPIGLSRDWKGSYNYDNLSDLLGDGIFAVDGDNWHQQRKLASHEFSRRILRDYSSIVFKNKASELAQIISEKANSKVGINIQDLFMKSTMDSIFKVGFGIELNVLHGSEEGTRFSNAFDNSSVQILRRFVDPFWKIKRYLNVGCEAELKKEIQIVDDFVYKVIDVKIRNSSSHENSPVKKDDLLSRFIMEIDKDPKNRTRKYLRDITLNFIIAGKDTTGGTLSWFIYMLCKHPHIQEKAAGEVKEAVKNVGNAEFGEFVSYLNDETLEKMHYLHAAITETLRLYPSVPLDSKVSFSNDTLPDGYGTNKGDILTYLPYAMGRMKTLWGDDAEKFRPERWIDTKGLFQKVESPFKFTAFQAGPRICLGKEFAYRQMKIFTAVLLNFFKFKLCDETEDVRYRTMVTLSIENGLNVYALQR